MMVLVSTACKYAAVEDPGESSVDGPGGEQTPDLDGRARPAGWTTYVDPIYGFRIHYPRDFVVRPQNVAQLAQSIPAPAASIFFMNPTMAAGDLAEIEPPDLEVRAYEAGTVTSLKSWLDSVGFAGAHNGFVDEPYRKGGIEGIEVCRTTMAAPGCSIFVLHGDTVYQLTPMTAEGEAMMETLVLPESPRSAKSSLHSRSRGNPEDVRRMVAGWQLVERQERAERRQAGPDPAAAIQGVLELMDLFGEMHDWPPPENEARRRDDEMARQRWVRVRNFYQAHGKAATPEDP